MVGPAASSAERRPCHNSDRITTRHGRETMPITMERVEMGRGVKRLCFAVPTDGNG